MNDNVLTGIPSDYHRILEASKAVSFSMASDLLTGSLLKTLAASKPASRFLELGTGSGLATSWILDGMDQHSSLISIDNNELLLAIAKDNIHDHRLQLVCANGYEWIQAYTGNRFDFIFADAMPGKYDLFEETWLLLNQNGFYVIDDMLPQPNWPEGHAERVQEFIINLENRKDLCLTKLNWSTGIIIVTKLTDSSILSKQ